MLTGSRPWAGVPSTSLFALVGQELRHLQFTDDPGVPTPLRVSEGGGVRWRGCQGPYG